MFYDCYRPATFSALKAMWGLSQHMSLLRHQFGHRNEAETVCRIRRTDDEMIDEFKPYEIRAIVEANGRFIVRSAWSRVARRMVVGDDDFFRPDFKRRTEYRPSLKCSSPCLIANRDNNGFRQHIPVRIKRQH